VTAPFLVNTFTEGMVTILVESYTLPVSQIWDCDWIEKTISRDDMMIL
jgi:hypothetical protein